ncbi:hypothetical protein, variant [Aphanomyces invadans]|uniref:FYVE-type domain-containing protein n=1 Tax=Aphanomyces invadans TaxID=157072 RepID=A0A024TEV3_9STRA|nr:hypothetical protein, variant [Aphanomyces invadans]ETV92690.1 hypothetical protein, variant [Aphanomyces invadans]|eukprot:XP_008878725.1 hypothetical protein, variant [Aphanomyces invadans]
MWCFNPGNDDEALTTAVPSSSRHTSFQIDNLMLPTASKHVLGAYDTPPIWVSDESIPSCAACHDDFDLFNRKHHCRGCGGVFCGTCSNHVGKVLKLGLTTDVRLCGPCAASAERENEFYGKHLPLIEAGAEFVKYGFLVERTVFVRWVDGTLQYQSINVSTTVLSGDVKAIPFDAVSSVVPVGLNGLYVTTPSQQHRLNAPTPTRRDQWLAALQCALNLRLVRPLRAL